MKRLTIGALACVLMTSTATARGWCTKSPKGSELSITALEQFAGVHNTLASAQETLTLVRRLAEQACSRSFATMERHMYDVMLDFNRYAAEQCASGVDNMCRNNYVSDIHARWAREDLTKSIVAGLTAQ